MDDDASYLSVAEGFSRLADTYDARLAGHPTILLEQTETLAALPRLTDLRVGDIGCGTGRYALRLGEFGAGEVIGPSTSRPKCSPSLAGRPATERRT